MYTITTPCLSCKDRVQSFNDSLVSCIIIVVLCSGAQCLLLFSLLSHERARYGDYIFPAWADFIGWMMSFAVAVCVPAYAIFAVCCLHPGNFNEVRRYVNRNYTVFKTRAQLSLGEADRTSRYLLLIYCLSPYACHYIECFSNPDPWEMFRVFSAHMKKNRCIALSYLYR